MYQREMTEMRTRFPLSVFRSPFSVSAMAPWSVVRPPAKNCSTALRSSAKQVVWVTKFAVESVRSQTPTASAGILAFMRRTENGKHPFPIKWGVR